LQVCPRCNGALKTVDYWNGLKTVQTMSAVLTIAYRPKVCSTLTGEECARPLPSAQWQQIAPKYSTYGYDVIAQIGWERQQHHLPFETVHAYLKEHVQISETYVRYLYHHKYLPLLACHERQRLPELTRLAHTSGLLLGLDGLMPEGGEPQLWLVRELQTGWTLRCGWLSREDETAFVEFLHPIADLHLPVTAVLSDKQRGLLPAVATVFPKAHHAFCQLHYLKNAATPIAAADEQMKITLRQQVRAEVGDLVRQKQAEKPAVLTVTGLVPSPAPVPVAAPPAAPRRTVAQEREAIVQDLLQRVRYLLTLKGRPPFRLAGIEMYARLQDVVRCLDRLLRHQPEPRLRELRQGLRAALHAVRADYGELSQAATWLAQLAETLDPEQQPLRSGDQVRTEWQVRLKQIEAESVGSVRLREFSATIRKVSDSYAAGLFYTYDLAGLPRTNNDRESEFRDLRRRLLRTTGQAGAVRRLLHRAGAWELIPRLDSLPETVTALTQVAQDELGKEQQRLRTHRARFRLHTRSVKQSRGQLNQLVRRWQALPATRGP
jgi:hypothetical protein